MMVKDTHFERFLVCFLDLGLDFDFDFLKLFCHEFWNTLVLLLDLHSVGYWSFALGIGIG